MSAHQKGPKAFPVKIGQATWQDILDFGDAPNTTQKPQDDVNNRLKALVRQLQEINRRIDNLNKHY
jgi:hypothetical protein